jgi:MtN3 and saliva related transmembrane protein
MSAWLVNAVGILAGIIGTFCWLPQLFKTVRTGETRDLSLWSNLMLFVTIGLWLVYGVALAAWPLVGSNVVALVIVGTILVMKLRHG